MYLFSINCLSSLYSLYACVCVSLKMIILLVPLLQEGELSKAVVYLELASRAGETGASHVKDVIVQQLSTASRDRAMRLAENWRALPSSR